MRYSAWRIAGIQLPAESHVGQQNYPKSAECLDLLRAYRKRVRRTLMSKSAPQPATIATASGGTVSPG